MARYRGKLSGPLLDRIDLMVELPPLSAAEMQNRNEAEPSELVRLRVAAARAVQIERQGRPNAALGAREIEAYCALDQPARELLKLAIVRLNLSGRSYHRVLRVARSIADLAAAPGIASAHIAEAVHYRRGLSDKE